jgi:heptosyltransferase I
MAEINPTHLPITTHHVLIVRADRLGDVLLSTPVIAALRIWAREAGIALKISLLAQRPMLDLLQDQVDGTVEFISDAVDRGRALTKAIKTLQLDSVLVLQNNRQVVRALSAAKVRHRVGPLGSLYTYFFYGRRGLRQNRSRVEKHEAEYGLDLVRHWISTLNIGSNKKLSSTLLGALSRTEAASDFSDLSTHVNVDPVSRSQVSAWLADGKMTEPYVVVHPGMGGSALNWPEEHYIDLVRKLSSEWQVILTGGAQEQDLLLKIQNKSESTHVSILNPPQSLGFLGALFERASLVIAPSTGPLHLSVAVGTPVVGFYPPIQVQSAKRWGP